MTFNPEFFGKYILLEKLATGGMAEVYLSKLTGAENVSKFVAVKRILPQFSQNQEFVEMFKEEAKIAVNLSHGNIVPIYEFGEQSGQFYLAMEYVAGRNLRQLLNRLSKTNLRLSLDQIVYIVNEVAKGLDYAHRSVDSTTGRPLNITHRDMSPQNVMVSFEGEVKIVDFGIAKAESKIENTRAGTLKGKFGYMSPEQAEGLEVDFRTDIFSLGIVLWELVSGERLFISNNEVNTLRKIRDCVVPSLRKIDPNIPSELERITNKALARDRNLRYQSAADFHRDLSRFLARQFPDFTAQDFSTFVKTIFDKEREEIRHKMVEYAKIQPAHLQDKTQYLTDITHTITETESSSSKKKNGKDDVQLQNLIPSEKLKSADNIELDVNRKRQDLFKQQNSAVNVAPPIFNEGTLSGTHSNIGFPPVGTSTSYTKSAHQRSSGGFFSIFLFLIAIAAGGYYLYTSDADFAKKIVASITGKSNSENKNFGQSSASSTSSGQPAQAITKYHALIQSTPSDAEIYIDGVKTEHVTPAQVELPANKSVKIMLNRRGYSPYETDFVAQYEGQEFRGVLTKRREAYVTVKARPGNPIIYIDRKPVSKNGEIVEYPVKPDTEVLVQAFDPERNLMDYRKVTVKENSVLNIELFVRKPSSQSTQKKSTSKAGSR